MLPTPPQSATAVGAEEEFGEATEFISWAAKGAADLVLPEIEENSDDDEYFDGYGMHPIPQADV